MSWEAECLEVDCQLNVDDPSDIARAKPFQ